MFLGEPTHGFMRWLNEYECGRDDWTCRTPPGLTKTVLGLTCHGCDVVVDPTGTTTTTLNDTEFTVVATTDGPITIDARMRFDATGKETTVTASATGDHEVALEARCGLVDSQVLAAAAKDPTPSFHFESDQIQACGSTRTSSQTVLIFPQIRTFQGNLRFPFCLSSGSSCSGPSGEPLRPRNEIAFPMAPALWGDCTEFAGTGPRGSLCCISVRRVDRDHGRQRAAPGRRDVLGFGRDSNALLHTRRLTRRRCEDMAQVRRR